jgi:DNA-binding NarL/FixJ family response regulator
MADKAFASACFILALADNGKGGRLSLTGRDGVFPYHEAGGCRGKTKGKTMDGHILIVEDHEGVRRSLLEWLTLSFPHHEILEAANAEKALIMARAKPPSLVIMDIGLPGINGIEAVRSIKAMAPAAHVVMLTIYDDDAHRAEAAEAGACAYIPKRKVQTDLLPALKRLLHSGTGAGTPSLKGSTKGMATARGDRITKLDSRTRAL